jgi:hypothetical protein
LSTLKPTLCIGLGQNFPFLLFDVPACRVWTWYIAVFGPIRVTYYMQYCTDMDIGFSGSFECFWRRTSFLVSDGVLILRSDVFALYFRFHIHVHSFIDRFSSPVTGLLLPPLTYPICSASILATCDTCAKRRDNRRTCAGRWCTR